MRLVHRLPLHHHPQVLPHRQVLPQRLQVLLRALVAQKLRKAHKAVEVVGRRIKQVLSSTENASQKVL